jgi:ankyrin repeat protein
MLGDREWVTAQLERDPALAQSAGAHGISVLFHAVVGGNLDMVQLLLDHGADIASITGPDATALNAAAWRGDEQMAAWLLERGANPDAPDFEGKTALQRAEENGHQRIAAMIRER